MSIEFKCECGQELEVADEHAGARIRCPECQRETTAPDRTTLVTSAEPPPAPKASPVKASRDDDGDESPRVSRRRDAEDDEDDRPRKRNRSRRDDFDEDDERDRRPILPQTSGMATASLVLGIVSLCLGALTGVPATILGLIAFIKIRSSQGRLTGGGKAIAGMVTGTLFSILLIVASVIAVQRIQEDKKQKIDPEIESNNLKQMEMADSNNLHQMALGIHNYESSYGHLPGSVPLPGPFGKPRVPNGKPQLSWRVELLPFIEQDALAQKFNLSEPWDGPTNKRLIPLMPNIYAHPMADPKWAQDGLTVYRVFTGPQCAFQPGSDRPIRLIQIADGSANTIMIAESAEPVVWTKPDELEYDANKPLPKLGLYFSSGYRVAMFDTKTRIISTSTSEKTLRAAITINGGEVLGPDW